MKHVLAAAVVSVAMATPALATPPQFLFPSEYDLLTKDPQFLCNVRPVQSWLCIMEDQRWLRVGLYSPLSADQTLSSLVRLGGNQHPTNYCIAGRTQKQADLAGLTFCQAE